MNLYTYITCFTLSIFVFTNCQRNTPKDPIETIPKEQTLLTELELKRAKMLSVQQGKTMPTGQLLNLDSSLISLRPGQLKDQLLVIDFWASWCSPCMISTPAFLETAARNEGRPVTFMAVSIDTDFGLWKKFVHESKWTGPLYWLGSNEADPFFNFMYGELDIKGEPSILISLPQYVFIAPSGEILFNEQSLKPSSPEFQQKIDEYLALVSK